MDYRIEDLYILLAEPSTTQSKIIINQFAELGITKFDVVGSGSDVLTAVEKDTPDLVIATMYLPDMSSTDLVHKLRDEDKFEELVFMLISTETSFDKLDPIKQAGATAVLPKPFSTKQLKQALYTTFEYLEPDELDIENFNSESMHVLVVDDSRFARNQIMKTLEKMGVENFKQASDGADAIPIIDSEYFDLIITDYNMPKVSGKELIEYVRTKSNQPTVPIMMVTTEENGSKLEAVEKSGVSAICDKPFEPRTVKAMIESVMAA
jgi:two-component system, chemotaxis family, chemotaxis protein CheY